MGNLTPTCTCCPEVRRDKVIFIFDQFMGLERAPSRWSPYSIRYKERNDQSEKESEKQKRKAYSEFTDEKEFDSEEGYQSGMTEFDSTDHEQKSTRSGNGNQDTSGAKQAVRHEVIDDPEDPVPQPATNPTWNYNPKPEAGEISSISSNTPGGFWG